MRAHYYAGVAAGLRIAMNNHAASVYIQDPVFDDTSVYAEHETVAPLAAPNAQFLVRDAFPV